MKYKLYRLGLSAFLCIIIVECQGQSTNYGNNRQVSPKDSIHIMEAGRVIFANTCQACHGNKAFPQAPALQMLMAIQPRAILNTLNSGKMRQQAKALSEKQREAVAQYISHELLRETIMPKEAYTKFTFNGGNKLFDCSGWGASLKATNFRSAAQAGISRNNIDSLKLKWAFAFPDASDMRSKPAIVGKWLLTGNSQTGDVYAIDRFTGKLGWHVTASNGIRSGIAVEKEGNSYIAYFADGATYVYAVDVNKGKILWNTKTGVGPMAMNTGTVAVYKGKVFVPLSSFEVVAAADSNYNCCSSSGGIVALNAKTGALLWYHRVIPSRAIARGDKRNGKPFYGPSGAPVWCSPTIDTQRNLIYIGTGENYTLPTTTTSDAIQAINMTTGKLAWNFQATEGDAWNMACPTIINCPGSKGRDLDFGMAPVLVTGKDGKQRLLAGQKSGVVYAINPENGKLLWRTRVGKGGALGGIHWGMAADNENVYATIADNLLALNQDSTNIKPTPGIYAIDIITGMVKWSASAPKVEGTQAYLGANSAAPIVIPGIVFAGSNDGHLRAYDASDGKILWDYNTAQKYETVNGVPGNGGSVDSSSPVIADGMIYVNSGYSLFGEKPGNVLLAFSVKK
ncbi:MAG TPA: PQQ-binding-like beta-propeller repeat protein [Hanamia sp.]|nr:PQQ-binding-like beta-propeller repeat protein [Hanamia sp.]